MAYVTTPRWGIPTPTGTENVDIPADLLSMATVLDGVAMDSQGNLADRPPSTIPSPGKAGRIYTAIDQTPHQVFRDYGTGWDRITNHDDPEMTDQRIPTNDSVTAAKINTAIKGGPAAGVEALRALGATATTAAAGNDARIPTQSENDALVGSSGAPSSGNKYVTDADARNTNTRTPTDATVSPAKLTDALAILLGIDSAGDVHRATSEVAGEVSATTAGTAFAAVGGEPGVTVEVPASGLVLISAQAEIKCSSTSGRMGFGIWTDGVASPWAEQDGTLVLPGGYCNGPVAAAYSGAPLMLGYWLLVSGLGNGGPGLPAFLCSPGVGTRTFTWRAWVDGNGGSRTFYWKNRRLSVITVGV